MTPTINTQENIYTIKLERKVNLFGSGLDNMSSKYMY